MKTTPRLKTCSPPFDRVEPVISSGDSVGRELDALELRAEDVRHRAREQRLRAAGRPFDQDVPVRERRDEEQVDGVDPARSTTLRPRCARGRAG